MTGKATLVLLLVVAVTPLWAMDSLNMPTGNSMKPRTSELNFIYVNQHQKRDPMGRVKMDDMRYTKLFTGVTDRIQIDFDYLDIKGAEDYWVLNGYYTLVKETASHPSLVVGATNLTGEDWLGGRDFNGDPDNDDASLFVLGAYTLARSPKPSLKQPTVRLQVGWGDGFHGEELFGMLQVKLDPRFGVMVQNYKSMPTYGATFKVSDSIAVSAGTMDANTFYRVGAAFNW